MQRAELLNVAIEHLFDIYTIREDSIRVAVSCDTLFTQDRSKQLLKHIISYRYPTSPLQSTVYLQMLLLRGP